MKKQVKLICLFLALAMTSLPFLTSCKFEQQKDIEGELTIAIYQAGFGVEFLDEMIKGYTAKNPNVKINTPITFIGDTPAIDMIKSGPDDNGVDLFIAGPVLAADLVEQGDTIVKSYDPILEDLSDVFNSKAYGDEITIKEKMYASVAGSVEYQANLNKFPQYEKYQGKVYSLPWAYGPGGLILNKNFFDAHPEYKVPNTSNELQALVEKIYNDCVAGKPDSEKVYPVIWAGSNASAYWRYITSVWIAQYDGLASWDRFIRTVDESGNYSDSVFNTPGMLKALEALAPIIAEKNCYPNSVGTLHTDAQVQFMRGKAAMLPSGDWTERETLDSNSFGTKGADDIVMIRTPVVSALGEKLGITDAQLSAVVSAVDEGKTSVDGISAEVFNAVKEARFITANCDFNHNIVIPAYSNAIDVAKDFIKYMFSDEGLHIFLKYANGFMPYKLELTDEEYSALSPFAKSTYDLGKTATMIAMDYTKSPIFYRNNLQLYNLPSGFVEVELGKKGPSTPQEVMEKCWEYTHNRWSKFLRVAGLS